MFLSNPLIAGAVAAVAVDVEAGAALAEAEAALVAGPREAEADFQAEVAPAHRLVVAVK